MTSLIDWDPQCFEVADVAFKRSPPPFPNRGVKSAARRVDSFLIEVAHPLPTRVLSEPDERMRDLILRGVAHLPIGVPAL
ncbi:hypothetical protein V6N11_053158 [Hibiscus sabdariffa]|uniref:Uncharacterized protein n=2 Tax=Hibiscus sabdariffa TaxID=183260 RepID=A0ABR2AY09_9ROSI